MSRWISKYAGYEFVLDSGYMEPSRDTHGRSVGLTHQAPIVLKFVQERMLPAYERLYAVNHWMNGARRMNGAVSAFGAAPSMYGGEPVVDGMGRMVAVTEGIRPDERFSVFDTDWLGPDLAPRAEAALRAHDDNGKDYVEVLPEAVPPPWPTYDQFTSAKKISDVVAQLGIDPLKVMEYEKATKDRPDVHAALRELHNEQLANAAIEGALTTETP